MPSPLLHHSAGTRDHNDQKRRLFLKYVDLENTGTLVKADGQVSLKRGKRVMVSSQEENQIHLKFGKELSPCQPDIALLHSKSKPVFTSTSYRQNTAQKLLYVNPPSLPPSSPPTFSSEGNDVVGRLEESDIEADPFGFLAAEKKLKDQRPRFPSITSYSESELQEHGLLEEGNISGTAFASQPSALNQCSISTAYVEQKLSPSASLFTNCSNDPSSPCRKAVRRRSNTRRKAVRGVEEEKDKDALDEPSGSKSAALNETFLPKHFKRNAPENSRTKRKARGTFGKRAPRRSTKSRNTRTDVLSHLNDEERKKFEREREERMAYYRRLDAYCVAKENVWVV